MRTEQSGMRKMDMKEEWKEGKEDREARRGNGKNELRGD